MVLAGSSGFIMMIDILQEDEADKTCVLWHYQDLGIHRRMHTPYITID